MDAILLPIIGIAAYIVSTLGLLICTYAVGQRRGFISGVNHERQRVSRIAREVARRRQAQQGQDDA